MKYKNIAIVSLFAAITKKWKILLLSALVVFIIGSVAITPYIYNKEKSTESQGVTMDQMESIEKEKEYVTIEEARLASAKVSQLNAYIDAILPYSIDEEKEDLMFIQENLNLNLNKKLIDLKGESAVGAARKSVEILFSNEEVEIRNQTDKNTMEEINKEIHDNIIEVQAISDEIVEENKLKIHDESKVYNGNYTYAYFTEKIDMQDTILAVELFLALFSIAIGYVVALSAYIKQNYKCEPSERQEYKLKN